MANRSDMHCTHCTAAPIVRVNGRCTMTTPGNEFLDHTRQGFGAYVCARSSGGRPDAAALTALAGRLGLVNEFAGKPAGGESVAFLRRHGGGGARALPARDLLPAD